MLSVSLNKTFSSFAYFNICKIKKTMHLQDNKSMEISDSNQQKKKELALKHSRMYLNFSIQGRNEGNVFLTTHSTHFILRLYGVIHMVKDHSDCEGRTGKGVHLDPLEENNNNNNNIKVKIETNKVKKEYYLVRE